MDKLEGKWAKLTRSLLMETEHPGHMQSVEGISGNYVLPESGFTYQSAILDYWALDNPDGEKAGCPGDIFPVTENVVFYASWRLVIVIPEIHAWGEWQSDAGKHWKKCSNCNVIGEESTHKWDSGEVTIQPTCTTAGQKTYTCTVCSATKSETMDARGHDFRCSSIMKPGTGRNVA